MHCVLHMPKHGRAQQPERDASGSHGPANTRMPTVGPVTGLPDISKMTLNQCMHPRNPYKLKRPDFKDLAIKHEKFREHAIQDLRGGVHIDFKNPEHLRALSWALLKEDFALDVDMPLDRLIPTIPLRLNYVLWLEDLLEQRTDGVRGVDIGAGASCVYPLLGAKKNGWSFLASEADPTNFQYAQRNVKQNGLADKITVKQVSDDSLLCDLVADLPRDVTLDFCMSNPPFFANQLEAWGMATSRSEDRAEPKSVCTASPAESIIPGGEVEFVRRLIEDSLVLKDRVRIYTSMLGRKSSVAVLRKELKDCGITNCGFTEFCQGRTMRWGLGWSFDPDVHFPSAPTKQVKASKPRPPVGYRLPQKLAALDGEEITLRNIAALLQTVVDDLKMEHTVTRDSSKEREWTLVAREATWLHQRRNRRQKQRQQADGERAPQEPKKPKVEPSVNGSSVSSQSPEGNRCTVTQGAAAVAAEAGRSESGESSVGATGGGGNVSVIVEKRSRDEQNLLESKAPAEPNKGRSSEGGESSMAEAGDCTKATMERQSRDDQNLLESGAGLPTASTEGSPNEGGERSTAEAGDCTKATMERQSRDDQNLLESGAGLLPAASTVDEQCEDNQIMSVTTDAAAIPGSSQSETRQTLGEVAGLSATLDCNQFAPGSHSKEQQCLPTNHSHQSHSAAQQSDKEQEKPMDQTDDSRTNLEVGATTRHEPGSREAAEEEHRSDVLLKCTLCVKVEAAADIPSSCEGDAASQIKLPPQLAIEMQWLDGTSKEMLHQVMQFIKNKLK